MKLSSSRRPRVAVMVGAIATTAALFAPSAVAKSDPVFVIDCTDLGGVGTVNVFANGLAKGHCSFPQGFPDFPGIELPDPLPHAVHVSCADLAQALGIALSGTPRGQATLTPSGNANVNCRDVFLAPQA